MAPDVIVIGAGASGLMCAATCGARGRSVLVLDHAERIGAKIRISGGGRCNFTNRDVTAGHYQSANPHFCRSALARFTPHHLLALVERHGIRYHEREAGQLFCDTSAREIVAMLQAECDSRGRQDAARLPGRGNRRERRRGLHRRDLPGDVPERVARHRHRRPLLPQARRERFRARCGAAVRPRRGPPAAGARALRLHESRPGDLRELAGVSLDAAITCGGKRHFGKMLFTHRGLSGPAALQASLLWAPGDAAEHRPAAGHGHPRRAARAAARKTEPSTLLAEHLPKRLARIWCEQRGSPAARPGRRSKPCGVRRRPARLAAGARRDGRVRHRGGDGRRRGHRRTLLQDDGGKQAPGLYFIGEVVDVTGELGGYNLHWAWASGFAAGQHRLRADARR